MNLRSVAGSVATARVATATRRVGARADVLETTFLPAKARAGRVTLRAAMA